MNAPRTPILVGWILLTGLAIGIALHGVSILRLPGELASQQFQTREAGLPPMDDESRLKLRQAQYAAWETRQSAAIEAARQRRPTGWLLLGLGAGMTAAFTLAAWRLTRSERST